jgi:hypothetical protein
MGSDFGFMTGDCTLYWDLRESWESWEDKIWERVGRTRFERVERTRVGGRTKADGPSVRVGGRGKGEKEIGRGDLRIEISLRPCLGILFLPSQFFLSFIECASSWRVRVFLGEEEGTSRGLRV